MFELTLGYTGCSWGQGKILVERLVKEGALHLMCSEKVLITGLLGIITSPAGA